MFVIRPKKIKKKIGNYLMYLIMPNRLASLSFYTTDVLAYSDTGYSDTV